MFENADMNNPPSENDKYDSSTADYLHRAARACAAGDKVLGMHLYLTAFERGAHGASAPSNEAVAGLRQAWELACQLKERSLAEYIFEKLEPYLTPDEVTTHAEQLQNLAFDKLEEFGLTREELENMTDMISQDFLGIDMPHLLKMEHDTLPRTLHVAQPNVDTPQTAETKDGVPQAGSVEEPSEQPAPSAGVPKKDASASDVPPAAPTHEANNTKGKQPQDASFGPVAALNQAAKALQDASVGLKAQIHARVKPVERISYDDLYGYKNAVALMRDFGIGMRGDQDFENLVERLNKHYGLAKMPACDTLLFRAPAREDANRFMAATLGELKSPALRMRMEESFQGMSLLSVMVQAENQPPFNAARNAFEGPAVLVLEDLDMWVSPMVEDEDNTGVFMFPSLSRGAREALHLIRSAVENPDVFVLASAATETEIDPFFFDLLEPLSVVDIDCPTLEEREEIWGNLAYHHPSLREVNPTELLKLSSGMPRYDMYMAVREAIEEAYKASLAQGHYVPVTLENLFDKFAACQPLDSNEYRALEDAVVEGLHRDLEYLEEWLEETKE